MSKSVAIISEHASPLTPAGRVDSGGQNIYVAHLARQLSRMGNQVDVFTRWTAPQRLIQPWIDGVRVIQIPAGPPAPVRKEDLLPHMSDFASHMIDFIKHGRRTYHVVHANFWMSGLVAASVKTACRIPFAITFHALGKIRRLHQKSADQFPEIRDEIERNVAAVSDAVIAECPQDHEDLTKLYDVDPAKIAMVGCGFDPAEFEPVEKKFSRALLGFAVDRPLILQLGRMVPRKGVETV
ncbi:MAG: glycosyltransferase, partial [Elusimicrobia bacterium]|nr:glycosyltransferase [Elusimicrobiota bacterium]